MVCYDGERTEADYFQGWRRALGAQSGVIVRPVLVDSGGNVLKAVNQAIIQMKADVDADEYWCVCDVDDTPSSQINSAISLASDAGLNLAISCRSFEVWIALHWRKISTAAISNETEARCLVAQDHSAYRRGPKVVPFSILLPLTSTALENAEWLERQDCGNPRTQVHYLVGKLYRRL